MLDTLTPLPPSPGYSGHTASSVVVIRSLSNKTSFETPDEFYQQMNQSELTQSTPTPSHRHRIASPELSMA